MKMITTALALVVILAASSGCGGNDGPSAEDIRYSMEFAAKAHDGSVEVTGCIEDGDEFECVIVTDTSNALMRVTCDEETCIAKRGDRAFSFRLRESPH